MTDRETGGQKYNINCGVIRRALKIKVGVIHNFRKQRLILTYFKAK